VSRRFLDLPAALCYKAAMWLFRSHADGTRLRLAAFVTALTGLALISALSCSSDPESSLGSDLKGNVLGSEPGDVFQDTIGVDADTVIYTHKPLVTDTTLVFGRGADGFLRSMIIQIPFTTGKQYTNKTIDRAELRLVTTSIDGSFPARFYRLNRTYAAGDTISTLDTLAAIPDPGSGSVERSLQLVPATYPIPNSLARGWMDSTIARTALAVVYTDNVNDRIATFKSVRALKEKPQVVVYFTDGTLKRFYGNADATLVQPTSPPSGNFVIGDGYGRHGYFRIRLDELQPQSAIHVARVRFHIVPGSLLGENTLLQVLAPGSSDPTSSDFTTGDLVTTATVLLDDETLELKLTNAIFLTLQGTLADNGFVISFDADNTEVRQLELYGSNAPDSLRPRVYVTSSTPARFTRP
jgi:hypothetical protein